MGGDYVVGGCYNTFAMRFLWILLGIICFIICVFSVISLIGAVFAMVAGNPKYLILWGIVAILSAAGFIYFIRKK